MKKDIDFPMVEGIQIAIVRETLELTGEQDWYAYLINQNNFEIKNVLITTKGYGIIQTLQENGLYAEEERKTSILRHKIENMPAQSYAKIERVSPEVFGLNNEFWLSYYHKDQLYDKKFIFVPESITPENCRMIDFIGLEGVLHK